MAQTTPTQPDQMPQYFSFLAKRFALQQEGEQDWKCRIVCHDFSLKIEGQEIVEQIHPSLPLSRPTGFENPSATFYVWKDSLIECLPKTGEGVIQPIYRYRNELGEIVLHLENGYLVAYDYEQRRGYLCFQKEKEILFEHRSHPLRQLLHWWANSSGYFLLHSAAVGRGNTGILIASSGGRGKSTLALGCLIAGLDYISDDYLLLRRGTSHEVFSIYATGYLHRDSLAWMPAFQQEAIASDPTRNHKTLFGLSQFQAQRKDKMQVKAIVFPIVTHHQEAKITKMHSTQAVMQMILSTAFQSWEIPYRDFVQELWKSVSSLPVYEMHLSTDIPTNAKQIEKFICDLS